jgi:ABC-type dipeptide/oligopeptide/nickel transport system ATPase component
MEQDTRSHDIVLQVSNLRTLFPVSRGIVGTLLAQPRRHVHAVDGVTFSVARGEILGLVGETPNPIDLPSGCRFHPRCPLVFDQCSQTEPQLQSVAAEHQVACLCV